MSNSIQPQPLHQQRLLGFEEVRVKKLGSVSTRKARDVVAEPWFPAPLELGPRCYRWIEAEIDEALASHAPRRKDLVEPAPLLRARVERMKAGQP